MKKLLEFIRILNLSLKLCI